MERGTTRRRVVGWLVLACTASAYVGVGVRVAGAEPAPGGGRVAVRSLPEPSGAPCLPGRLGMSYETTTTSERFVLRIRSTAPRCEPIVATAAVYAMPTNGMAWPQRLVKASTFEIASAGSVEVVFERTCAPSQFDVVTGATPDRIAPWADWHGPLLFPFDLNTAFQDPGGNCGAPSTTAVPPSTVAPSTTTPGGTTSVPDGVTPTVDPTPTTDVEVLAVTMVPGAGTPDASSSDPSSDAPAPTKVAGLALTGATTGFLVGVAVLMIVFGTGFVVGSWLRTRARG